MTKWQALLLAVLLSAPVTLKAQLPAPAGVQPAWVDEFSTVLTWDEVAGAESYRVYRYDNPSAAWVNVADGLTVPYFSEAPLAAFPLEYAVTAVNSQGEGPSAQTTITNGGQAGYAITVYPPNEFEGTLSATTAQLRVAASPVEGVWALVELGQSPQALSIYEIHPDLEGFHTFTFENLTPATQYYYKLVTVGSDGLGFSMVQDFWTRPANQPPVANNVTVTQNGPYATHIVLSGSDPDYPPQNLSAQITTQPTMGTLSEVSYNWDGTWSVYYTPNPGVRGTDSFQFVISDGELDSTPATATITGIFLNTPPSTGTLDLSTPEDTPISFTLPADDADGDPLFYQVEFVTGGALTGTAPEQTWTPDSNYNGSLTLVYTVTDTYSDPVYGSVSLNVVAVDDPPTAQSITLSSQEDMPAWIAPVFNDPDGSGSYSVTIETQPQHGTATLDGTTIIYIPAENYFGSDSFTYSVTSDALTSAPAAVSIEITPFNDTPSANFLTAAVPEDGSVTVLLSGSDVDGDALAFQVIGAPANGTILGSGSELTYVPNPNFNGTDSFSFVAHDGQAESAPATVTIAVASVNDSPVATSTEISGVEDTAVTVILTGSDPDEDSLTFQVIAAPANGLFTLSGAELTYQPGPNFNGTDSITFVTHDGQVESAPATLLISIAPANDLPVADSALVSATEDTAVSVTLGGSDLDGDQLTFQVTSQPANGTLSGSGGNLTYQPNANFFGEDSFSFVANDGQGDSSPATVVITVAPVNDAPIANAAVLSTSEDTAGTITLTGSDVDGDNFTFLVTSTPANGSLSISGHDVTYQPNGNFSGSDSFTFVADDGQAQSATATVTITIAAVDDAPTALPQSVELSEDATLGVTLTAVDIDGGPLSFTIVSGPANGLLSGTVPNLTYNPQLNFFGADSFVFAVSNGSGSYSEATIAISVLPVNDVPVANSQSVNTAYNSAVAITLTGSDLEQSNLSYTLLSQPANGVLSGAAPNLTFQPTIGWFGTTTFQFKANDGALDSSPATVTITVAAPAGAPAVPSSLNAVAASSSQINLAWVDNSVDEDGFVIERSTNGSAWVQAGTVGPGTQSFASTGLASNKTYYHRVRAYNVVGNSDYSNTASARTLK